MKSIVSSPKQMTKPMDNDGQEDTMTAEFSGERKEGNASGWDPYILSIFSRKKKAYPEERRRKPRTREANRRRALLLAKARRAK